MWKTLIVVIIIVLLVLAFTVSTFRKSKDISVVDQKTSTSNVLPKKIIAEGLDTPWSIVFLPDGSFLVSERPGRVRMIDKNGNLQIEPVAVISNAKEIGEGGLLGMDIDPKFTINHLVYLYYTYGGDDNQTLNRVVRMNYLAGKLQDEKILVDKIPGAPNHNGGRIKFGPDGFLYITTGDAENPSQAQDINSLAGKILRITTEGKPAPGNLFNSSVYSYGHRNPQGLAWDKGGNLWSTEHGRSGTQSGLDELNLIKNGKNYGWPMIQGSEKQSGMETPVLNSGTNTTWAPAGITYLDGSLFFGGLRGESLYEVKISDGSYTTKQYFRNEYGRIRDVILGPDGMLYITTSNMDGRGTSKEGDDKIIRVNPNDISSN